VYAIDQRNHGRSPHDNLHTYDAMAEDLAEFLNDNNFSSASLMGHSMGGKTAMQFALHYPALVHKLIVVDIGPATYPSRHDSLLDALLAVDLTTHTSRSSVEESLARGIQSPVVRQFLLKNLKRTDDGFTWKLNLEVLSRQYDQMNRSISGRPFPNPTLFIRSLRSGYIGKTDLSLISGLFPGATFAELDVGHWVHAEAPDQFYRIVMDFLLQGS